MTDKYDKLAAKDPIFGVLRNVMDLAAHNRPAEDQLRWWWDAAAVAAN